MIACTRCPLCTGPGSPKSQSSQSVHWPTSHDTYHSLNFWCFALTDGGRLVPTLCLSSKIRGGNVVGTWDSIWQAIHPWASDQASQDSRLVHGD